MKMTKVVINSVTIKDTDGAPDPNKLINWDYDKDDEEISEAELILPKTVDSLVNLTVGQVVEIHGGWATSTDRRFFYGFIETISPEGAIYRVKCSNEMVQLVRKNVNKIYDSSVDASAGEISEIVEDLIETFGGMNGTVQPSGTSDGQRIDEFKCVNTDIFERIQVLKKALNWDLYYDDNTRVVFFEPKGFNDSGKTLTVGTEIIGIPEWDFDKTNMINDLRVDGATTQTNITENGKIGTTSGYETGSILLTKTPDVVELLIDSSDPPTTQREGGSKDASTGHFYYLDIENKKLIPKTGTTFTTDHYSIVNYVWSAPAPIHMANAQSIADHGIHEKAIELPDVSSVADAESRATNILANRSSPYITGKVLVKSTAANIPNRGEVVTIIDGVTPNVAGSNLNGQYVVNKIKYSFPSAIEVLELGDKKWVIADWQQSVEERVKRLEEKFVGNQDLLMELKDFQNIKTGKPRWRKVLTEAYNTGNNIGIWGNATHGIWGTDVWGTQANAFEAEADHFIQQFENSYTEDFIDEDFKDTDTTATWSGNGEVVL